MQIPEPITPLSKDIAAALFSLTNQWDAVSQIEDYQEREGKKATLVIMAINDIEQIFLKHNGKTALPIDVKIVDGKLHITVLIAKNSITVDY